MTDWKKLSEELDLIADIGIVNYKDTGTLRDAASAIRKAIPEIVEKRRLEEKNRRLEEKVAALEERIAIMTEMDHTGEDPEWPPKEIEGKEIEGGGSNWWVVCEDCHVTVGKYDKVCPHCGRSFVK